MAIARHLAIDRRLIQLSHENEDLSDDIGKLEAVLQLHQDLTTQRASSARNVIRKEVGGPIWQSGAKGKMNKFRGKKDIVEPDSNGVDPPSSVELRAKTASGVRSRPGSASRRRRELNNEPSQTSSPIGQDITADLLPVDGGQILITGNSNQVKSDVLETTIQGADQKENGSGDMKESRTHTARIMSIRHVRSHSASGPKRNRRSPSDKPNVRLSGTGQSIAVPGRGSSGASEEEEEGQLFNPELHEQTYVEKVSAMKDKVLKKILNKVDLDIKLKECKKANKAVLESAQNLPRQTSERIAIPNDSESVTRNGDKGSSIDSDNSGKAETLEKPPVIHLDPHLESWLKVNDLYDEKRLKAIFRRNKVTMARLKYMTDSKLRSLGITNTVVVNQIRRGLLQLKADALKSALGIRDPQTHGSDPLPLVEDSKSRSPSPERETNMDSQSIPKESNKPRSKSMDSKEKVPYAKPAWGSSQGSRAFSSSQAKPRTRHASGGPAPRMRPSSVASSRDLDAQKTSAPLLSRTGLVLVNSSRLKEVNANNADDLTPEDIEVKVIKRSPREVRQSMALELPDLQVTGAMIVSPTSPGRRTNADCRDTGRVRHRSNSPNGRAARSALQTMEQQIQILQQRANTTGEAATVAMIAQLQAQLLQVQRAMMDEPRVGATSETTPRGATNQDTEVALPGVSPKQGSFITAALAGNVRPLSCRKPSIDNPDQGEHDEAPLDDRSEIPPPSMRPPTAGGASGGPRRAGTATASREKQTAPGITSLNMSMSKQAILKEVRKKAEEHRRTVKHLESELSRLKHKDPLRSSEVDEEDVAYNENSLIGEGAFSQVFHGMFQGAEVAVKRLKVPLTAQDKNYFIAEVNLLRELRHPRVVLLMGVCTMSQHPLMVLEFMSGGSLYGYLHDDNSPNLDHVAFYQIAQDIAVGMNYLHRHRPAVLHLDLKSMNVLLTDHLRAKIADFGFSKLRHDAELVGSQRGGGMKGTPAWMAPELLNTGDITTKADVYSYGLILWEMLTRQRPYKGCSMFQVIERVRKNQRPDLPESCPPELSALITACWHHNPAKRPSFQEVLVELEELHFPAGWKTLFAAAGLPQVTLDDIEATRSIIDIVSQTIASGQIRESQAPPAEIPTVYGAIPAASPQNIQPATVKTQRVVEREERTKGKVTPGKIGNTGVRTKIGVQKGTAGAKPSELASAPPPPSLCPPQFLPPPPPPLPTMGLGRGPNAGGNAPPPSINFMGQLRAKFQDIMLKPVALPLNPKSPGKVAKDPSAPATPDRGGSGGTTGGFMIEASELQNVRQQLRPTAERTHPNQLRDMSDISPDAISEIADVLRRAVVNRRVALNEVNSIDRSQAYTDSGWSLG